MNYVKERFIEDPEIIFDNNFLFFISPKEVRKIWLKPEWDKSKFKIYPKTVCIENNQYVNSWSFASYNMKNEIDVKGFCKSKILESAKKDNRDVKDRIGYLVSDGEKIENTEPLKDFYDIVALCLNLDYETLDKVEFDFKG